MSEPREWKDDPEMGDEDDPEYQKEIFATLAYGNVKPEEVRPGIREAYTEFLKTYDPEE